MQVGKEAVTQIFDKAIWSSLELSSACAEAHGLLDHKCTAVCKVLTMRFPSIGLEQVSQLQKSF
jgi:hypothetical protein